VSRALVWRGLDGWRAEYADVWLRDGRLVARGVQVGVEPFPYEARYSLDTSPGYDTAHLSVNASGAGWSRHLDLRRDRVAGSRQRLRRGHRRSARGQPAGRR